MASPAAAAAILVLFDCTATSAIVIPCPLEITLMAGSAEGRVLGRGIWNDSRHGIAVAAATPWIPSVVARIVPGSVMAEAGGRPAAGGMTYFTL